MNKYAGLETLNKIRSFETDIEAINYLNGLILNCICKENQHKTRFDVWKGLFFFGLGFIAGFMLTGVLPRKL